MGHLADFLEQLDGEPTPAPPKQFKVYPMTCCLDGRPCQHLTFDGWRNRCNRAQLKAVFDLDTCPDGKWFCVGFNEPGVPILYTVRN